MVQRLHWLQEKIMSLMMNIAITSVFWEHVTDYHRPDDGAWCGQGMLVDSDVFITLVLVTWRGCGSRSGLMCRIMGMCLCLRLCDGLWQAASSYGVEAESPPPHPWLHSTALPSTSFGPLRRWQQKPADLSRPHLIPLSFPLTAPTVLPLHSSLRHVLSLNHSVSHLPLPPGDITAHSLLRVWTGDVHRTTAAWFKILFLFASSGRPLWHWCSGNDRPKGAFQWRVH